MKNSLNYQEIPTTRKDDYNKERTKWIGDRLVSMDCGGMMLVYVGHHTETVNDEEGNSVEKSYAWPIEAKHPVSRASIINAAEMQAYGLTSAIDIASFAGSLSRKYREDVTDPEVKEHDEFIRWIKEELDKSGYTVNDVISFGKVKQSLKGKGTMEDPYKGWKAGEKVTKGNGI